MAEKIDFSTGRICPHGEDNRCEFLNEDNLCDIVLELAKMRYVRHAIHIRATRKYIQMCGNAR